MTNNSNNLLFKPAERNIKTASKIFFACHPVDYENYFEDITNQILEKAADNNISAVFCYLSPDAASDFDVIADFLENIQLIVVPVTWDLLLTPNMITDKLLPYALKKHIPVLPLLQDLALTHEYSKHFGNIQFLCNDKNDKTAIPYDVKLNDFIKDTLVGDELRRRVQAAFDAYIFLSYRKKDRKAAQEIMHLIHQNEFCRDVAIWYDEFLTPGEDFNKSIQSAIQKSDLFAMVITPNIIEPDNYIIEHEYPMASTAGKTILPLESIETNKQKLSDYYEGIPTCTDVHNSSALSKALQRNIKIAATQESHDSPEHNYLIGLAYLTGIDVEVNHQRGIELIRKAAEADLPEAVARMVTIYRTGMGCEINYNECELWLSRLVGIYKKLYPRYDSEGWLRLMHSCYSQILLHNATSNTASARAAANEAIYYAKAVQKGKDIYYVCHVLSFAYLTLASIDQQQLANNINEADNILSATQKVFKAALPSLHQSEKVIESYVKRHPQDNCSMLQILTYSQLLSTYGGLRKIKAVKKYVDKLMAIFVAQNNQSLIDELNFQWLLFKRSYKIDFTNEKNVKEYFFSLMEYFDSKEITKETALTVFQIGYQICSCVKPLISYAKLNDGEITLFKRLVERCLYAYELIPKKYITNFMLSAASNVLSFATSVEKLAGNKQQEYVYWQKYLQTVELIYSRHNTLENKRSLQKAMYMLAMLAVTFGDYDDAFEYGGKNYGICQEITKEAPDDESAFIDCVKALSFSAYYFICRDDAEKCLKYAKLACDMAKSVCKMFDSSVGTLFNLANVQSDYADFLFNYKKYSEAIESCKFADSVYHMIINQNKATLSVSYKTEIIDALCDNLKLLADVYYQANDAENAEKQYLYFLRVMGDDEEKMSDINDALHSLAKIYAGVNDLKKAGDYYKKLVSNDPDNEQYTEEFKVLKHRLEE